MLRLEVTPVLEGLGQFPGIDFDAAPGDPADRDFAAGNPSRLTRRVDPLPGLPARRR